MIRVKPILLLGLFLALITSSCFRNSEITMTSCIEETAQTIVIESLYSTTGIDWNDYVVNDGSNRYNATDTTCVGNETGGYSACLHGGQMRVATLVGITSCSSITATDNLGIFDWVCDASTGTARIISDGINNGKGLTDLLDFDILAWKDNRIEVRKSGCLIAQSSTADWLWTNPIVEITGGEALNTLGTIYVAKTNITSNYTFSVSNVALIIKPGNVLTGAGTGTVVGSGQQYTWIEGEIDSSADGRGIFYSGSDFSVIRNVKVYGATSFNIDLFNANNNLVDNVEAYGAITNGLLYNHAIGTLTRNVNVYNTTGTGLVIGDTGGASINNVFINTVFSNNGSSGISTCATCHDNILYNTVLYNNSNSGIYSRSNIVVSLATSVGNNISCYQTNDIHLSQLTIINSADHGLIFNTCSSSTASQIFISNNTIDGIPLWNGSSSNIFSNIVSSHNGDEGITAGGTEDNNVFSEIIKVGNNPGDDCSFSGAGNQLDNTCTPVNGGTATVTLGIDNSSSIVGKVSSDSANSSDSSGSSLYDSINDWTNFDNWFRGWGQGHADLFPSANHQGRCITAETCQIWDAGLRSSDSVLRNVISCPDGNNTLSHTWNVGGTTVHLNHAVEIMDDRIGNDNALCESGETCLYTPNIGAYQGHGSIVDSSCPTVTGTITNVILKQYVINGIVL